MSDKKYNGWTNYETWNLALWIDNDQGSYEHWRERASQVLEDKGGPAYIEEAACDLADELKSETEDNKPEVSGFYGDVLNAAISEVNWYEIAMNWLDDIDTDEPDEKPADYSPILDDPQS